jgi:hypothetical protein
VRSPPQHRRRLSFVLWMTKLPLVCGFSPCFRWRQGPSSSEWRIKAVIVQAFYLTRSGQDPTQKQFVGPMNRMLIQVLLAAQALHFRHLGLVAYHFGHCESSTLLNWPACWQTLAMPSVLRLACVEILCYFTSYSCRWPIIEPSAPGLAGTVEDACES